VEQGEGGGRGKGEKKKKRKRKHCQRLHHAQISCRLLRRKPGLDNKKGGLREIEMGGHRRDEKKKCEKTSEKKKGGHPKGGIEETA